jgi:hypothetical protein
MRSSSATFACVVALAAGMAASPNPPEGGDHSNHVVSGFSRMDTLAEVLKRAAHYVAGFHTQLTSIVAEETYTQSVDSMLSTRGNTTRTLKSDLILVRAGTGNRYVELRDVFEVDGRSVRDREARLEQLLGDESKAAGDRLGRIIQESARYNIGTIERNINTPLLPLLFLQQDHQDDFRFKPANPMNPPEGGHHGDTVVSGSSRTGPSVFRVTTEMWAVEFEERGSSTTVRDTRGRRLPAKGRFWINPESGAVLISELVIEGSGVTATVTVSYQTEPLMGFLVPIEMRESYVRSGERITGHAVYGRFRTVTPRAR